MTSLDIDYERFLDCVHCGLCLSACPTYAELGTEMDSPRGRIYLMRALADGKIEMSETVVQHLDLCLGCLACETACPSGVDYSRLIEWGRAEIERRRERPIKQIFLRKMFVEQFFPYPKRLRLILLPVRIGRRLGLFRWIKNLRVPESLTRLQEMLPANLDGSQALPEWTPAMGERKYRVGLVTGCVGSVMFAGVNAATVRVLAHNGCDVIVPPDQVCCGALHIHNGNPDAARVLIRKNVEVFSRYDLDAIISNAAGCGTTLKEYGDILADETAYAERAREFQNKTRDICEFLEALPDRKTPGALNIKVTYHDACHLAHGQRIRTQPRILIASIPGLELLELSESDWCCGSAGIYNLAQPEMSEELLERKLANIVATGAQAVITGNPGCLLQIGYGLRREGLPFRILHPVELLDLAYASLPAAGDEQSESDNEL